MPDNSPILSLPYILPAQAQKHVTHNEAIQTLDVIVQLAVSSRVIAAPPGSPATGGRWIVASGPTGAWAGQAGKIAMWNGAGWEFTAPLVGWQAWVIAESQVAVWTGSAWTAPADGPAEFSRLGVSMAADPTNRLAVESPASLFQSSTGSHQMAISKAATGDTASLLLQTGHSTRAEIGLVGDNDLSVKVSPDGTSFQTAISVDKDDGRVTYHQPMRLLPAAGDASAPVDGMLWYNSTTGKFRARQNGTTTDLIGAGGGGAVFSDADFELTDNLDPTKTARFQLSGIGTGLTRTFTLPNTNSTLAVTGTLTQTFSGPTTFSADTLSFGSATGDTTIGLGNGATGAPNSKTVDIGTAGVSGSTTTIKLGSSTSGALGTVQVNTPSLTVASTSVSMASANAVINQLGLGGATADATNRLSVSAPGVLFNHAGSSVEATINRSGAGDSAAFAFKTGFSTRAQIGNLGSTAFQIRVSADGTAFNDALSADAPTGQVTLAKPVILAAQAADPGSPVDGMMWYNSTSADFRVRAGSVTRVIDTQLDVPYLIPVTNEHILTTTGAGGTTTGTLAGAANRIDIFPFVPRADTVATGLSINCTTLVAAALGKLVIYGSDANGRPDALILETGTLDLSTTGVKTIAVATTLLRGRTYWLGLRHSSTATVSTWAPTATPDINGGSPVTTARKVLRRTVTFATGAPTPWVFASSEINNAAAPAIWVRV